MVFVVKGQEKCVTEEVLTGEEKGCHSSTAIV